MSGAFYDSSPIHRGQPRAATAIERTLIDSTHRHDLIDFCPLPPRWWRPKRLVLHYIGNSRQGRQRKVNCVIAVLFWRQYAQGVGGRD